MGYVADHHETLLEELTDKQRETLEKFDDCYSELVGINERDIFIYAFKLGMRIAIEVLSSDKD
jgi:protoheme ferro-lyase